MQPTLTFLFTDIEGSTQRWEHDRAAMSAALARHDGLLRAAIEGHGGQVFKTVGDAFYAVFEDATAALTAAHAAQRALSREDWSAAGGDLAGLPVRAALHAGQVDARDGDFFGPPLNRVARLLAIAHGGQTLVSEAVAGLVRDSLPDGAALADLGEHRLKDLSRPERIYQLLDPDLRADFPPLRSLDSVPGNLPVQLTSFVGRAQELAELDALLDSRRLVTLTGVGGTGKTRLALAGAASRAERYPDGAWFVDLAPLTEAANVAELVAATLGARDLPGRSAEELVSAHLERRLALVVLDNCEHVIGSAAALVAALLRACPKVTLLATSREPLAVAGETVVPLAPLTLPGDLPVDPDAAALARFTQLDAVRLFVERATAAQPAFGVTSANAPAIAEICRRLDGIPLALELAAARVRSLAPDDIARRLDQRFRLLTGGGRDRLPRQQTLQAAIDWSYKLLSDTEQRVLARMSVFATAMPLAAVEAVATGGAVADFEAVDALDQLVAKSLVTTTEHLGETQYRLLDTVRAYAAERLAEAGEGEVAASRGRQLGWYLAAADEAGIHRDGEHTNAWRARLAPQREDLAGGVTWALARPELAAQAVLVIDRLWWLLELKRRMLPLVLATMARADELGIGDDHPYLVWSCAWLLADCRRYDECPAFAERAIALADAKGDDRLAAWAHQIMSTVALYRNDLNLARRHNGAAIRLKEGLDDAFDLAIAHMFRAEVERLAGNFAAAAELARTAMLAFPPGERQTQQFAWACHNHGQALVRCGRGAAARVAFLETLSITLDVQDPICIASTLAGLGGVAAAGGDGPRAMRLMGACDRILADEGVGLEPSDEPDRAYHAAVAQGLLDEPDRAAAYAAGWSMGLAEAVAYALGDRGAESQRVDEVPATWADDQAVTG